ncbi:hypothetical protein RI129_010948 [Pyrocoelia pectoralis]|uniref:Uncharacterized protein n=1 Tax=Pyrocoelia pectoralis TaxID=417401 RepID=A0AAN7V313_9COLE
MKLSTILLQVVFGTIVLANSEKSKITPEKIQQQWATLVAPYVTRCLCESGANRALAEMWSQNGQITTDPCLSCYILCIHRAVGYYDVRNELTVDVILAAGIVVPESVVRYCVPKAANITDLCLKSFTYSNCVLTKVYEMKP